MLNKVLLIGHLGQAPQIKRTQGGQRYATLTLATSRRWKDKATGEPRDHTEWHRVVIWQERLLDVAEKYLTKGSKVWIEGSLGSRKWTDNDGVERYATEILLQDFGHQLVMLDRKPGGVRDPDGEDGYGAEPDYVGA
jgi:single-strand DNA-binding protein